MKNVNAVPAPIIVSALDIVKDLSPNDPESTYIISPAAAAVIAAAKVNNGEDLDKPVFNALPTAVVYTSPVVEESFTYQVLEVLEVVTVLVNALVTL